MKQEPALRGVGIPGLQAGEEVNSAVTVAGSQPSPVRRRSSVDAARHSSISAAGVGRAAGSFATHCSRTPRTCSGQRPQPGCWCSMRWKTAASAPNGNSPMIA